MMADLGMARTAVLEHTMYGPIRDRAMVQDIIDDYATYVAHASPTQFVGDTLSLDTQLNIVVPFCRGCNLPLMPGAPDECPNCGLVRAKPTGVEI